MSKYTTQLRYICEQKAGYLENTDDYITVINKSYDKIIHPQTTLYDPAYAPVLYKKILKHYYYDEIAHETTGQFIMRLNTKLDEILPYYNKLYESAALKFNPMYDVDYTVEGNRKDDNTIDRTRTDDLNTVRTDDLKAIRTDDLTATRTDNLTATRTDDLASHSESVDWDAFSDTPEGSLSGVDSNSYLTNARKNDSEADGTNTGTQTMENTGTQTTANTGTQTTADTGTQTTANTGTQSTANTGTQTNNDIIHSVNEYFEHVTGKRGGTDYADLIRKFRDTFINIDMMIINDLQSLFMGVY